MSSFSRVGQFGYDLGRWPQVVWLDTTLDNITGSPFTLSSSTEIVRANTQFDATTRFMIDQFPTFESDTTNLTLLNEGDDIDYNRALVYFTPIDALVDRFTFNLGLGLNVSAYTSGNFRLNRVSVDLQAFKASGQADTPVNVVSNFTTTNMTAVDNQILIFNNTYTSPLALYAGGALTVSINIDNVAGVGTFQKGIMSAFPYQNSGGLRTYSKSCIGLYVRPNPIEGSSVFVPMRNAVAGVF